MAKFDQGSGDTEFVLAAQEGDDRAFDQLFDRWFDGVWNVSMSILRDPALATTTAQEIFLAARQQLSRLEQPNTFGSWLLRSSRNKSLNTLEERKESAPSTADTVPNWLHTDSVTEADISNAYEEQSIIEAISETLGDEQASILDLHLRHGLTAADLEDELGRSDEQAEQSLQRLTKRLDTALGNYVLWNHGKPACKQLAKSVSGEQTFTRAVGKVVRNHQRKCASCVQHKQAQAKSADLFSAIPISNVPAALKSQALNYLQADSADVIDATGELPPEAISALRGPKQSATTDLAEPKTAFPNFVPLDEKPARPKRVRPHYEPRPQAAAEEELEAAIETKFRIDKRLIAVATLLLVATVGVLAFLPEDGTGVAASGTLDSVVESNAAAEPTPQADESDAIENESDASPKEQANPFESPSTDLVGQTFPTDEGQPAPQADEADAPVANSPNTTSTTRAPAISVERPAVPAAPDPDPEPAPVAVVRVPDIVGQRAVDGNRQILLQGLETSVERVPTVLIDQVGLVQRTSPAAGAAVSPGDTVTVYYYVYVGGR